MRKKLLTLILCTVTTLGILSACSKESDATNDKPATESTDKSDKKEDKVDNTGKYKEYFNAYAEFYDTFYKDNFQQEFITADCAGKIILDENNNPLLVIVDTKRWKTTDETAITDLLFYTYEDEEVKERTKIPNIVADGEGIGVINYDGTIYAMVDYGKIYHHENPDDAVLQFFKLTSDSYTEIKADIHEEKRGEGSREYYTFEDEADLTAYNVWYLSEDEEQSFNLYCNDRDVSCLSGKDFKDYLGYLNKCNITSNLDMEIICTEYMFNSNMYDRPEIYYAHDGIIYQCITEGILDESQKVLIDGKPIYCIDKAYDISEPLLTLGVHDVYEVNIASGKTITEKVEGVTVCSAGDDYTPYTLYVDATKITEISKTEGVYKITSDDALNGVKSFELNVGGTEYFGTSFSLGYFTESDGKYTAEYYEKPAGDGPAVMTEIDFDKAVSLIEAAKTNTDEKVIVKLTINNNILTNVTIASDNEAKNEAIKACVAYKDYLDEKDIRCSECSLFYLDNDDIPEMLVYDGSVSTRYLVSYDGKEVVEILSNYTINNFKYAEKTDFFYYSGLNAMEFYEKYSEGKLETVASTNFYFSMEQDYTDYYKGETKVTEEEYNTYIESLNLNLVSPTTYDSLEEAYNALFLEDWKKAYISYINENLQTFKFYFASDLNNDGIREIIYIGDSTAEGEGILTYYNNSVEDIHLQDGSIYYIPDECKLYHSYGRMGYYGNSVFHLEGKDIVGDDGGEWYEVLEGDELSLEYKLKGKVVSKDEYESYFETYSQNESNICINQFAFDSETLLEILSK